MLRIGPSQEDLLMRILQPAEWSKPRGFSHGVEVDGPGIGAAWKETLGRNFPPSTLLYIEGLVDYRAKVEIEVTAFVPKA